MTKKELEQLKGLKAELRLLTEELNNLPVARDSVKGSMPEYPYIERVIQVSGIDENRGRAIRKKLEEKQRELQEAICDMEEWLDSVPDPDMRSILRLKYRNGCTQDQIAKELGYDRSTISKKINLFWREL